MANETKDTTTSSPTSAPGANLNRIAKRIPVLKVKIKQKGKVVEVVKLKGKDAIDYLLSEGKDPKKYGF
jgi:primase-polymerase (primpol)-like protein